MDEDKSVHEQDIKEKKNEALKRSQERNKCIKGLCYLGIHYLTPFEYYFEKNAFREFQEPKIRDFQKAIGITLLLRIKSLFSSDANKQLKDMKAKAEALHKKELKESKSFYESRKEKYYQIQEKKQDKLNNGDRDETIKYIKYALVNDDFSVDGFERYQIEVSTIDYKAETSELSLRYRIPCAEEMFAVGGYIYDEKQDEIIPKELNDKEAKQVRLTIARSVILRAAAMVYLSDKYRNIKNININGYLTYFEDALGNYEQKDVMNVNISREIFEKINLEKVNVDELFKKFLKSKESKDLYNNKPYEPEEN